VRRWRGWGLPVPPGFHVTTKAYREFLMAGEMPASVAAAIAEAYSGVVEGVARVITDVRDGSALHSGEILVTTVGLRQRHLPHPHRRPGSRGRGPRHGYRARRRRELS
jgi:phosphoenolpyruvate synthase/pyruvate phosphate dikinase